MEEVVSFWAAQNASASPQQQHWPLALSLAHVLGRSAASSEKPHLSWTSVALGEGVC